MTYAQTTESSPSAAMRATDTPKAIGLVRNDVSGPDAPHHAAEVRRHASELGFRYLYTVRPPVDFDDPIGYLLGIAAGLDADVIVVYDLAHVDDRPASICDEGFDLETVCPKETWACSARPARAGEAEAV